MWIVRFGIAEADTFVVMTVLILVMGVIAILRTPTNVFPHTNIPVVSIIWNYSGLLPKEMPDRVIRFTERNLTTAVGNIEHVESQSLYGTVVVKVFMQVALRATSRLLPRRMPR